jgi:hypothetical protein
MIMANDEQYMHEINRLEGERDHYKQRNRESENQLCRIANYLKRDATAAPENDKTIAGLVIAEVERLRKELEKLKSMVR